MNWDRVEGHWRQWKGRVMVTWGTFTNDPVQVVAGKRDQRFGRVQRRHGFGRDEADRLACRATRSMNHRARGL